MKGANRPRKSARRKARPLDPVRLEELALAYVARFATTAGKLRAYLSRKLRERGWEHEDPSVDPDEHDAGAAAIESIVERFVDRGYVDDAGFARMRSADLLRRGYGGRRVQQALMQADVAEDVRTAVAPGEHEQRASIAALARKRRFGPYGKLGALEGEEAFKARDKQLAAMLRAGHDFEKARWVLDAAEPEDIELWVEEAREEGRS